MAAGLAAIPQVDPGKSFSVGAGSGYYDGQTSLAVGMSARVDQDWVVKAGVSTVPSNSQYNQMVNVGVGYSW
jgi:autotransporter adhesin